MTLPTMSQSFPGSFEHCLWPGHHSRDDAYDDCHCTRYDTAATAIRRFPEKLARRTCGLFLGLCVIGECAATISFIHPEAFVFF